MAIPITFLMLFVALMLIIVATYYVAVTQISARGQLLNFYAAKQSMTTLENSINSVLWTPGASQVFYLSDFGGSLKTSPTAKTLRINVTDNTFTDTIFNGSVGKTTYELATAEPSSTGLYLEGDSRTIVNSSASTMTQLRIVSGQISQEIVLSYRPLASSSVTGTDGNRPINTVRIYIVNLNLSQSFTMFSGYLKAKCSEVVSGEKSYNVSYPITSLQVKAWLDGKMGIVSLPISSGPPGAVVDVEVLVCNVQLQRVGA